MPMSRSPESPWTAPECDQPQSAAILTCFIPLFARRYLRRRTGGLLVSQVRFPGPKTFPIITRRGKELSAVSPASLCAVIRRFPVAGANPAQHLSLQLVAVTAYYGGNDMV